MRAPLAATFLYNCSRLRLFSMDVLRAVYDSLRGEERLYVLCFAFRFVFCLLSRVAGCWAGHTVTAA